MNKFKKNFLDNYFTCEDCNNEKIEEHKLLRYKKDNKQKCINCLWIEPKCFDCDIIIIKSPMWDEWKAFCVKDALGRNMYEPSFAKLLLENKLYEFYQMENTKLGR